MPEQNNDGAAEVNPTDETGELPEIVAEDGAKDGGAKKVNFKAAREAYEQAQKQGEAKDDAPAPAETTDYKTLALRTAAEFDNFRKRVAREKTLWKREALAEFLKDFIPAFDDLNRAILEGEKGHSYETIHDGAKLVRDNLWKVLGKSGVKEIEAADKPFNPRFHEAMTAIPLPGKPADMVVEVFQAGYMLDEFVLRPARVVVSAPQPGEEE